MNPKLSTSVPASMAGYIVQLRRALFRLAEGDPDDVVGVETLDDVAVTKAALLQLEQDKLSLVPEGTIGARSDALWRTLDIWTDRWVEYNGAGKEIEFHFVTNRVCKGIVQRFSIANRTSQDDAEIVDALAGERGAPKEKGDIQELINRVLDKGDETLLAVISRIRLNSGRSEFDDSLIDKTIGRLHLSPDLTDAAIVYQGLFGWLVQSLIALWENHQPGTVSRHSLDRQLSNITDKLNRARVTARAARFIDITEQDIEDARKHRFLFHLANIRMADNRIDEELLHYIRFSKEKLRLTTNGSVPPPEWEGRGDRLTQRWQHSTERHTITSSALDPVEVGMLIFLNAAEHREPLDGNEMPEAYMTLGHYHRLADDDVVYWNPSFGKKRGD